MPPTPCDMTIAGTGPSPLGRDRSPEMVVSLPVLTPFQNSSGPSVSVWNSTLPLGPSPRLVTGAPALCSGSPMNNSAIITKLKTTRWTTPIDRSPCSSCGFGHSTLVLLSPTPSNVVTRILVLSVQRPLNGDVRLPWPIPPRGLFLELEVCPMLAAVLELEGQPPIGFSPRAVSLPGIRVLVCCDVVLEPAHARSHGLFDIFRVAQGRTADALRAGITRREDIETLVSAETELDWHGLACFQDVPHRRVVDGSKEAREVELGARREHERVVFVGRRVSCDSANLAGVIDAECTFQHERAAGWQESVEIDHAGTVPEKGMGGVARCVRQAGDPPAGVDSKALTNGAAERAEVLQAAAVPEEGMGGRIARCVRVACDPPAGVDGRAATIGAAERTEVLQAAAVPEEGTIAPTTRVRPASDPPARVDRETVAIATAAERTEVLQAATIPEEG